MLEMNRESGQEIGTGDIGDICIIEETIRKREQLLAQEKTICLLNRRPVSFGAPDYHSYDVLIKLAEDYLRLSEAYLSIGCKTFFDCSFKKIFSSLNRALNYLNSTGCISYERVREALDRTGRFVESHKKQLGERDYEAYRGTISSMIEEIKAAKPKTQWKEIFDL